jgi:bacteriorhodopsin
VTRFTLLDTNQQLVNGRLRRQAWSGERFIRWLETFPLLVFNNYWLASRIAYVIRRIRIKLGLEK